MQQGLHELASGNGRASTWTFAFWFQFSWGWSDAQRAKHLGLRDDEWAQAVVADGTRHREHAHDPHAVPEQDLATRRLHTRLQNVERVMLHSDVAVQKFAIGRFWSNRSSGSTDVR